MACCCTVRFDMKLDSRSLSHTGRSRQRCRTRHSRIQGCSGRIRIRLWRAHGGCTCRWGTDTVWRTWCQTGSSNRQGTDLPYPRVHRTCRSGSERRCRTRILGGSCLWSCSSPACRSTCQGRKACSGSSWTYVRTADRCPRDKAGCCRHGFVEDSTSRAGTAAATTRQFRRSALADTRCRSTPALAIDSNQPGRVGAVSSP